MNSLLFQMNCFDRLFPENEITIVLEIDFVVSVHFSHIEKQNYANREM